MPLSNVIHHWDISDEATLTRGSPTNTLNSVADKVGSCTLTASTANSFGLGTLSNGLTGVGIDSRSNLARLNGSAFTVLSVPTTPLTVSLVCSQANLAEYCHFDLGTNPRPVMAGFNTAGLSMSGGISAAFASTAVHHWLCIYNGASSELYQDGVLFASGDTGSGTTKASISIASVVGGNLDGFMYLGEMRVATGVPTTAERDGEIAIQMAKWGL